jgi:hypothetical protein
MSEFDEAAVWAWVGVVPGLTAAQRGAAQCALAADEYDGRDLAAAKPRRLARLLGDFFHAESLYSEFARQAPGGIAVPDCGSGSGSGFHSSMGGSGSGSCAEVVRLHLSAPGGSVAEVVRLLLSARDAHLATERSHAQGVRRDEAPPSQPAGAGPRPAPAAPSCEICFEPYSQAAGVVPRILIACGHTFCEGCLGQMLRPVLAVSNWKPLECPKCRTRCNVHGGRASALPTNYDIMGA